MSPLRATVTSAKAYFIVMLPEVRLRALGDRRKRLTGDAGCAIVTPILRSKAPLQVRTEVRKPAYAKLEMVSSGRGCFRAPHQQSALNSGAPWLT